MPTEKRIPMWGQGFCPGISFMGAGIGAGRPPGDAAGNRAFCRILPAQSARQRRAEARSLDRTCPFFILLLFAAAAVPGQTNFGPEIDVRGKVLTSGSMFIKSIGATLRYETAVSSPATISSKPGRGIGGGISLHGDRVSRMIQNPRDKVWFGYDVAVSGSAETGFILTFGPPTGPAPNGTTPAPIRKYPPAQTIHDGDIVAIDLMVNADGTEKLTDYVQVISPAREPHLAVSTTTAEPRDFALDDGPVNYNVRDFAVLRGGQLLSSAGFTGKPGATFWIAFPNQGRYILSLVPHEGFTKSGAIRDNVISFDSGGQPCEIRFLTAIAGAGKAWNLYVMHDLNYRPPENQRDLIVSGTDRLDRLAP